ncbi:MAG: 4-(cytidine 5'-diphospho)-2-C-methyl-D-erythritol kinase [Hyphomicrobiaceae bacterium]|nr:4-(cytidine 5'-diphospho)-2-C-methyl-D-erythritol kinase [Hyphomicrobiaceae bacterium]
MTITERARAKVNLTLRVLGRRPDGYHEVESLVAFADAADEVAFEPGLPPVVTVSGPYADDIVGLNIAAATLAELANVEPRLTLGSVHIIKNLPVAAGIGGGSANAAAVLRAVRQANPARARQTDWEAVARKLGADVPVCLLDRAVIMRGLGERLEPISLPALPAVLVNAMAQVPADKTARVFKALAAAPLSDSPAQHGPTVPAFRQAADVTAFMRQAGNDLAAASETIVPQLADVLHALGTETRALATTMSGAGPTCVALFSTDAEASAAAAALAIAHPGWWVVPTTLR